MIDEIYAEGWPERPTLTQNLEADWNVGNKIFKALDNARKKRDLWKTKRAPIFVRKPASD